MTTGKTERRAIRCFMCPNAVELVVTLGMWHDRFEYCLERSAEILGFRPTDKGPACPLHVGMAVVRERK